MTLLQQLNLARRLLLELGQSTARVDKAILNAINTLLDEVE